jgi:hypothetical protein
VGRIYLPSRHQFEIVFYLSKLDAPIDYWHTEASIKTTGDKRMNTFDIALLSAT